jgi:hypothetical protein
MKKKKRAHRIFWTIISIIMIFSMMAFTFSALFRF